MSQRLDILTQEIPFQIREDAVIYHISRLLSYKSGMGFPNTKKVVEAYYREIKNQLLADGSVTLHDLGTLKMSPEGIVYQPNERFLGKYLRAGHG